MKRIISRILILFSISTNAHALCEAFSISSLSSGMELDKNGIIILEFYAISQDLIPELNKKHPIYLESKHNKIKLNPIEILKGESSVTQVVLKPSPGLIENDIYTLKIDNLEKFDNFLYSKPKLLTFKIYDFVSNKIPTLIKIPFEQKKSMIEYGCGTARYVYFDLFVQNKSELFALANIKNKTTGLVTNYIFNLENGVVKIGEDMCNGAINFENGSNFEVAFQLLDQLGNKSNWSKKVTFTKPVAHTND